MKLLKTCLKCPSLWFGFALIANSHIHTINTSIIVGSRSDEIENKQFFNSKYWSWNPKLWYWSNKYQYDECVNVRLVIADNLNLSVSYHSDKPHVGNDVIWPIWRDFVFKIKWAWMMAKKISTCWKRSRGFSTALLYNIKIIRDHNRSITCSTTSMHHQNPA